MELGTAIIGLATILACIIPFVLISKSNKQRTQKIFQALSDWAAKSSCSISKHDIWNQSAIGIDASSNMIFFYQKSGDQETRQKVNLAEVEKCLLINTSRTLKHETGEQKVIEKLELTFSHRHGKEADTSIVFFDTNSGRLTLAGELQMAEKWYKIANEGIESFSIKHS